MVTLRWSQDDGKTRNYTLGQVATQIFQLTRQGGVLESLSFDDVGVKSGGEVYLKMCVLTGIMIIHIYIYIIQ